MLINIRIMTGLSDLLFILVCLPPTVETTIDSKFSIMSMNVSKLRSSPSSMLKQVNYNFISSQQIQNTVHHP